MNRLHGILSELTTWVTSGRRSRWCWQPASVSQSVEQKASVLICSFCLTGEKEREQLVLNLSYCGIKPELLVCKYYDMFFIP